MDSRLCSEDSSHRTAYHQTNWSKYPNLDLLIITNIMQSRDSCKWMEDWGQPERAKKLLVFHSPEVLTSRQGKWYKGWCKVMKGKGYNVHTWHIKSTECGASIRTSYIVTYCYSGMTTTSLPLQLPISKTTRACQNLIRTYGVPPSQYFPEELVESCPNHPHDNCIGTLFGRPVYHWDGPFVSATSTKHNWILVPDKGVRKIQLDEMEKMKGLQSSRYTNLSYQILATSIEHHVYAAISVAISPTIIATRKDSPSPFQGGYSMAPPREATTMPTSNWTYSVPDLCPN